MRTLCWGPEGWKSTTTPLTFSPALALHTAIFLPTTSGPAGQACPALSCQPSTCATLLPASQELEEQNACSSSSTMRLQLVGTQVQGAEKPSEPSHAAPHCTLGGNLSHTQPYKDSMVMAYLQRR